MPPACKRRFLIPNYTLPFVCLQRRRITMSACNVMKGSNLPRELARARSHTMQPNCRLGERPQLEMRRLPMSKSTAILSDGIIRHRMPRYMASCHINICSVVSLAVTFHQVRGYFPSQRDQSLGRYQIILLGDRGTQV